MINIYISQGNGKTLTAIGTALKEAEKGNKVIFTQFLTDGEASELKMLQKNGYVAVLLPEAMEHPFAIHIRTPIWGFISVGKPG